MKMWYQRWTDTLQNPKSKTENKKYKIIQNEDVVSKKDPHCKILNQKLKIKNPK